MTMLPSLYALRCLSRLSMVLVEVMVRSDSMRLFFVYVLSMVLSVEIRNVVSVLWLREKLSLILVMQCTEVVSLVVRCVLVLL